MVDVQYDQTVAVQWITRVLEDSRPTLKSLSSQNGTKLAIVQGRVRTKKKKAKTEGWLREFVKRGGGAGKYSECGRGGRRPERDPQEAGKSIGKPLLSPLNAGSQHGRNPREAGISLAKDRRAASPLWGIHAEYIPLHYMMAQVVIARGVE